MTEQEIFNVSVPVATKSYAPVSHYSIVNEVREELDKKNLIVRNTDYIPGRDGKQLVGYMNINSGDPELGFRFGFRNSYDKSMSAAVVAGGNIWICGNGQVHGEIAFIRKHTGSVAQELKQKIIFAIDKMYEEHVILKRHNERMKQIEVNNNQVAHLAGELFMQEEIITSTQLNILKKEVENPSFNYNADGTLWNFYNGVTHALKTSHPTEYFNRHQRLHNYVETKFELI